APVPPVEAQADRPEVLVGVGAGDRGGQLAAVLAAGLGLNQEVAGVIRLVWVRNARPAHHLGIAAGHDDAGNVVLAERAEGHDAVGGEFLEGGNQESSCPKASSAGTCSSSSTATVSV